MADNRLKNVLKLLLKVAVTILCLWYVSRKIDFLLTWDLLQQSDKWWLFLAAIFFVMSKVVSSFRLNFYLRNIGAHLPELANLKLYWLGMFYNLFLPGGIGGDAYKVIVLNRRFGKPVKKLTAAILLDRISGVAGLGILSAIGYFLIFKGEQYSWWLLAAVLPGLAAYYLFVIKLFPSFVTSYWSTLVLGIVVQLLQVVAVFFIMSSIDINVHRYEYILLFLVSSVVAILPFTIGGLGAREVVFLWGSQHFALDSHQSIYISLLFYLITLVTSFVGIRWVYADPLPAEPPGAKPIVS
ncbi:flippase-like domain-containing protein [Segetibacter sp. 3557_3]|uniref:lysylphosphatidylglycerol synthase transmembrane domain-containing protein n=1 Tax=Segetibacter sp. 3557_3 TaxID=2547429 RepID=UPI00105876CA|nr:lysylphosphatidylglycerol synthase transmembrane domain-containing protein [Segetibacter sp. 3557_3]TDH26152.1 flippase-like domain-containing protein [Segetibacter sp. 3557_3]